MKSTAYSFPSAYRHIGSDSISPRFIFLTYGIFTIKCTLYSASNTKLPATHIASEFEQCPLNITSTELHTTTLKIENNSENTVNELLRCI
jgi:hypothetical protein